MRHSEVESPKDYFDYENKCFVEMEPTRESVWAMLKRSMQHFHVRPFGILKWAPKYTLDDFIADASAACVIGVMLVPQGMAYALLAGVDPIYGLYTAFLPIIIYPLFTSSSQMSPGPIATTSIILEGMVRNSSGAEPFTHEYTQSLFTLSSLTGFIQLLLSITSVNWVATLLSQPIMSGYATAASFTIIASQLKDFFGLTNIPKETFFFH